MTELVPVFHDVPLFMPGTKQPPGVRSQLDSQLSKREWRKSRRERPILLRMDVLRTAHTSVARERVIKEWTLSNRNRTSDILITGTSTVRRSELRFRAN